MQQYDVVIVGAGASGLMCAATAGYRGRRVLVLEHTSKIGRKILMSGGGRCNFTNIHNGPANFLSGNPHFCKSALSRYPARAFIELVERHGIDYHEKTLGQLFCDHSSKEILQLLLTECDWAGVEIRTDVSVNGIKPQPEGYRLDTSSGAFGCESLVIATGGLSIPNGGATSFAFDVAEQFGLEVTERRAALVPFTLQPALLDHLKPLAGISHKVSVSAGNMSFTEQMLLTHRGLSGPAILQISSYWQPGGEIEIDLFPELDLSAWLIEQRQSNPKQALHNALGQLMTKRFAQTLCELWQLDGILAELSNARIDEIAAKFHHWKVKPAGTEGYRTAEVTLGGVATSELSSKTLQANKADGLYFIGECVDVTGHLGGHNFQWAWASGFAAGQFV
ncbi:BaiN/RdsA family NAD(P)/FAD-dependent oxidoreductase [Marinobacterium arenosum]|uniref:NAD(P)/FAD-dependent oxidoreductase n=1 Tax=Marinobacterium arenosum TaxID=2862496 RepID=UPI001C95592B|nr:NAD(P)/FAD-dependent oxidoreductase [Marinobacterium arenosum]MBY4678418.1 NAD(P)/FAD-dependent oxidoreductase [Marinobacterium arenosum]